MNKSIGWVVACLFGVVACNVERYEDCHANPDDPFGDGDDFGGSHTGSGYAGSWTSAGRDSGKSGSANSEAGSGASAGTSEIANGGANVTDPGDGAGGEAGAPSSGAPLMPCETERDCAPGYNCDLEQRQCLPAEQETCAELDTEVACSNRKDCTPVYGGTNCSCGQDCVCHGGEPGCVCESFQFFACQDAP